MKEATFTHGRHPFVKNVSNISLAQTQSHINKGSLGFAVTYVILWENKHRFIAKTPDV